MLTLTDRVSGAGAERLAGAITLGLDPERFERTLCVSRWDVEKGRDPLSPVAPERLEEAGVRVIGLTRRGRFDLLAWWPLIRLLRAGEVDVIHAHKFGSNVWASILGRATGVPVVVAHEHTWSFEGRPLRRLLDRELIARASDAFVAVSREDRRRMIEVEGIRPSDIVYVPNGISPQAPQGQDVRAELGIPAGAPLVGVIGTLRPQKALDVFLASIGQLRDWFPEIRGVIAGAGTSTARADLEALIVTLGLNGRVMLLGERGDVPDVLAALDVVVLSSDFEGSPLALMEAMEAARPIAATAVGGVPDLIDDGVHGRLVPPRDPDRLAHAIAELLRDPERAREMGLRAQERRRREFDLSVTVRAFEALYERLYAGKRPDRAARGREGHEG